MRIAVVSDIHGNRTAFEAVLNDLRETSPDLIFHGGDLVHGGWGSAELVDRVRDLGWPGVLGNTDEMMFAPETLTDFAAKAPHLKDMFATIEEMAAADRDALGKERIQWLRGLPRLQVHSEMAVVHASPQTTWSSPGPEAGDAELESAYGPLNKQIVVYGHIHRPHIRKLSTMTVINSGSVSASYDGDPRAAYLVLDDFVPTIRRVAYDVEKEIEAFSRRGLPHADWIARILRSASPQLP